MRAQVLSSGSGGNSLSVLCGEMRVLVDAGLPMREQRARLEHARIPLRAIDHIVVSHAHLDHARCAGALAKHHDATLHCAERCMSFNSMKRAPRFEVLPIDSRRTLRGAHGDEVLLEAIPLPHDCDPTVALRLETADRRLVVLTDMGRPDAAIARRLRGAHVLVLEFNYDERMLAEGPYPEALKRRVSGDRGHLSNTQASSMLAAMAGPELHTLVLAHISQKNNTPELALAAARATLQGIGREDVEVLVASQDEIGPLLTV